METPDTKVEPGLESGSYLRDVFHFYFTLPVPRSNARFLILLAFYSAANRIINS